MGKYFGTDGWYVTKYLREQFASIDTSSEGELSSVQRGIDDETQKQNAIISEIEREHAQRVADIGSQTTQMLSTLNAVVEYVNSIAYPNASPIAPPKRHPFTLSNVYPFIIELVLLILFFL